MSYRHGQPTHYPFRACNKGFPKYPRENLSHNDFYFSFAKSLRRELEDLRKVLTNRRRTGNIPEPLMEVIERTYGRAMQATYLNFFRGSRVSKEFFRYIDALDTWASEQKKRLDENVDPPMSSNLQQMLAQLFEAIEHYVKQCKMTKESYKAGCRLPIAPTNWAVKSLIKILIEEYAPTGKKRFPPYKIVSRRLIQHDPKLYLSERTYRSYKRQIESGTFTDLIQRKRH